MEFAFLVLFLGNLSKSRSQKFFFCFLLGALVFYILHACLWSILCCCYYREKVYSIVFMSFFLEKTTIFPLSCLWTLVEKQLIIYGRECFWNLSSIPLIYGCVTLVGVNSPNLFFVQLFWLVLVNLLYILELACHFLKKSPAEITGFCKCIDQFRGELTSW